MKICFRVGLSLVATIVFAVTSISFAGESWNVRDLGYVGSNTRIADINDAGVVVGQLWPPGGAPYAFVMDNGVITDLGINDGEAIAVNNAGQVIGNYWDPFRKAFFWQKGNMVDLGGLGGRFTVATAINDSGEVVGYSQTEAGYTHAFIWKNGVMTDLGTLSGGNESVATAINDAGEVAGLSSTSVGYVIYNVFRWAKGRMQDLGRSPIADGVPDYYDWSYVGLIMNKKGEVAAQTKMYPLTFVFSKDTWTSTADPNATHNFHLSVAEVINDKGVFAGTYFDDDGDNLGFVWSEGETTYIKNPDKEYVIAPDYALKDNSSRIYDMNNKGVVVGSSYNLYGPGSHAIVWEKGVTTLLPTLFGDEGRAFAINKKGEIAGLNRGHMVLWTKK